MQGFYCERCRRFMLLAEDMNAHLRSITHYRNFVTEVKSLTSNAGATESKETEQSEVSCNDSGRKKTKLNCETVKINIFYFSQNEKSIVEIEEHDGSTKRRKIAHEDEENDKPKEPQGNNADNANTQKKSDGEEKYDPLEADAESEEDETREAGEDAKEAQNTASNGQDKKTLVDEIWTDADNDNDVEMGNLIDDADEKEHVDHDKSPQKMDRNHTSPKPSRGRGFVRGRGGPRARRSRR